MGSTSARTFVGEVEKILEVETADGARVKTTEGHPFFVEGRGFIAARKLARGDLLRRVDGRRVAVVALGWEEARTRVYNFEVEGTHTYYAAGVWVHNAGCPADVVRLINQGVEDIHVRDRRTAEGALWRLLGEYDLGNSTGDWMSGDAKKWFSFGSTRRDGWYHWDDVFDAETGRILFHGANDPHGALPHLQLHLNDNVFRIFWPR